MASLRETAEEQTHSAPQRHPQKQAVITCLSQRGLRLKLPSMGGPVSVSFSAACSFKFFGCCFVFCVRRTCVRRHRWLVGAVRKVWLSKQTLLAGPTRTNVAVPRPSVSLGNFAVVAPPTSLPPPPHPHQLLLSRSRH